MATALVAGAVVVLSFQFLTARTIARAQAFFFVQHMFTISVEAATLCVGAERGSDAAPPASPPPAARARCAHCPPQLPTARCSRWRRALLAAAVLEQRIRLPRVRDEERHEDERDARPHRREEDSDPQVLELGALVGAPVRLDAERAEHETAFAPT